jgi:dienelactone hydrolase
LVRQKLREATLGKQFTLTTTDKHSLGAYRADPAGTPKGGMVVVQEIFGVNHHIRAVCDRLAALGYVAVAPAVFDRFVRDFESGYTPDEIAHARSYLGNLNWDHMMADVAAAQGDLKGTGPLGVVGFCMGGTAAFLAACRIPVYQEEAVAGRDLHLPRRAARLLLRRARELPQRSRRPRLEAHTGIPVKAYEEIARAKQAFLHVVAGRMPGHLRFRTTVP